MALDAEDTAAETALHRGRDWKGYAAMLMAILAVVSTFRKQPEDAAKAGYIELTTAILDSQAAEKKNHEDIVTLSESLESYIKGHTVIETTMPSSAPTPSPPPTATPTITMKVVHVAPMPSATAAAPITPLANQKKPKSVDAISW